MKQRMQLGVLNAERILRQIREQGYTGGITVLREFMKPLRPVVSAKATERFESDPGEQAQIDLGVFPTTPSPGPFGPHGSGPEVRIGRPQIKGGGQVIHVQVVKWR